MLLLPPPPKNARSDSLLFDVGLGREEEKDDKTDDLEVVGDAADRLIVVEKSSPSTTTTSSRFDNDEPNVGSKTTRSKVRLISVKVGRFAGSVSQQDWMSCRMVLEGIHVVQGIQ